MLNVSEIYGKTMTSLNKKLQNIWGHPRQCMRDMKEELMNFQSVI